MKAAIQNSKLVEMDLEVSIEASHLHTASENRTQAGHKGGARDNKLRRIDPSSYDAKSDDNRTSYSSTCDTVHTHMKVKQPAESIENLGGHR